MLLEGVLIGVLGLSGRGEQRGMASLPVKKLFMRGSTPVYRLDWEEWTSLGIHGLPAECRAEALQGYPFLIAMRPRGSAETKLIISLGVTAPDPAQS